MSAPCGGYDMGRERGGSDPGHWTPLGWTRHNRARDQGRERSNGRTTSEEKGGTDMEFILWILAVILVISGIVSLVRGAVLWGIVLIIVGLLVGPGGVSIFT